MASWSLPVSDSGLSREACRTKKMRTREAMRCTRAAAKEWTCGEGAGMNFDMYSSLQQQHGLLVQRLSFKLLLSASSAVIAEAVHI